VIPVVFLCASFVTFVVAFRWKIFTTKDTKATRRAKLGGVN